MAGDRRNALDCPNSRADIPTMPSPDWLYHHLTISGDADELARFRMAATGAGVVPWRRDYDALIENLVALMMAAPLARRRISLADARILAEKMRDLIWSDDQLALARYRSGRSCPFDLHRLVPVPAAILVQGDDAPMTITWLWQHWGTTWQLRRVRDITTAYRFEPCTTQVIDFWSADWSPWRAIQTIAAAWPTLTITLHPIY